MSEWAPKRFWKEATAVSTPAGFTVQLDGKPVRTPLKAALIVPTLAMAEAIAAEWNAQEGVLDPGSMPSTRAANSAIDKVRPQHSEVAKMLAAYGGTDLLSYRAEGPEPLVAEQAEAWDPLLDWLAERFDVRLGVTSGVIPVPQDADGLARLDFEVANLDPFQLAAFHDLVAISGSLVIALAVIHERIDVETAWKLSRIDETWQIRQWGEDEMEAGHESLRHAAFLQAWRFWGLCR